MSQSLRVLLSLLGVVLIAVPGTVVATLLLFPFWSWLEASTGLESVGHSGPAEWCYVVVFALLLTGGVLILVARHRGRRPV